MATDAAPDVDVFDVVAGPKPVAAKRKRRPDAHASPARTPPPATAPAADQEASERRTAEERAATSLAFDLSRFEPGPDDTPDDILDAFLRKAACCHPDVLAAEEYKKVPDDLWVYEARGPHGKWIAYDKEGRYLTKRSRPSPPPPLSDVTMSNLEAWTGRRPQGTRADFARLCALFAAAVHNTKYAVADGVHSGASAYIVYEIAEEYARRKRVARARAAALDEPWLRVPRS